MRAIAFAALAFLIGLVMGWGGALVAYVVVTITTGFVDRDGGAAMGVAFGIGPIVGLTLGTIGALVAVWRTRARAAERARGVRAPARSLPRLATIVGGVVLGAAVGLVLGFIGFWVLLPQPLSHTFSAIALEFAPFATGLAGAVIGGLAGARAR